MQKIALHFLSGLISGIIGTMFFTILLFQSASTKYFNSMLTQDTRSNIDLKYLFLMLIVFTSMIVLCEIHSILSYLFDKNKYIAFRRTTIYILIAILSIEIIMIPIYMIFASINNLNLYLSIMIQIVFSIILTQLIIDNSTINSNPLINSFSIILSTLISILIILFIASITGFAVLIVAPMLLLTIISLGSGISSFFILDKGYNLFTNDEDTTIKNNKETIKLNIIKKRTNLKHDYNQDFDG